MVFHWSLSDSKFPRVSRTLLSILVVLSNVVVWMVSTRPPTSKSSSPISNPLVTVPNAPITIGIIITFMFHSLFNSQARSWYLSFFSHSFSFILWLARTAESTILHILFFMVIIWSGLLAEIRGSVCMSKSHIINIIIIIIISCGFFSPALVDGLSHVYLYTHTIINNPDCPLCLLKSFAFSFFFFFFFF